MCALADRYRQLDTATPANWATAHISEDAQIVYGGRIFGRSLEIGMSWPGGIDAKGSEGGANNVGQIQGAIGYVEYACVKQNKLAHANMIDKGAKTIAHRCGEQTNYDPFYLIVTESI
jgi:hypothetical protein